MCGMGVAACMGHGDDEIRARQQGEKLGAGIRRGSLGVELRVVDGTGSRVSCLFTGCGEERLVGLVSKASDLSPSSPCIACMMVTPRLE